MTEYPYAATPTIFSHAIPVSDVPESSLLTIARSVFLAMEKLRISYVMILAFVTLFFVFVTGFLNLRLLGLIVLGAVVANAAYFAGPAIESYVQ